MAHIGSIVVRSQSRKDGGSVVLSWGVEAAIQMATMGGVVARARVTVSSHFAVCVQGVVVISTLITEIPHQTQHVVASRPP